MPTDVIKRLRNDDQLAALLASGVAYSLQLQSAVLIAEEREVMGAELAADLASTVPGLALGVSVAGGIVQHGIDIKMEEQRGRIALALLADAGYDPWQAPEAWRLLGEKTLPKDLDSLKYPNRSGYQLGILNLQYGGDKADSKSGVASGGSAKTR